MDSARSSRKEDDCRRRRSESSDSEQDSRHRRRMKEREAEERKGRSDETKGQSDVKDRRPESGRKRYDDGDRKRRRSRSPESSRRRHDHRDSKYRSKTDPSEDRGGSHRSSREGSAHAGRKSNGPLPSQAGSFQKNKGSLPSQATSFQKNQDPSSTLLLADELPEKQKPNFAPTGLLAAASNSVAQADGTQIVLKYHEPAEARKAPAKDVWKLFVFKGADIVETIELSLRSCWLIGRELAVVDLPAEHPSVSKQHAVIQFRYIEKRNEFGDKIGKVRPYLIDLDSANGTMLNKDPIESSRYLELRDKDMIQFGDSTREYVLMLSP